MVTTSGGLISYDYVDQPRRAASYVDRILKGEKPADLPIKGPDQVHPFHQPQDGQGAQHYGATDATRKRRRGFRIAN